MSIARTLSLLRKRPALLCFSPLRWDSSVERPRQLLARCADKREVYYIEEPVDSADSHEPLEFREPLKNIIVVTPRLPRSTPAPLAEKIVERLVVEMLRKRKVFSYDAWYYALPTISFTGSLAPEVVIYDCAEELLELSGSQHGLQSWEARLFDDADVVFTSSRRLYELQSKRHPAVHCFPSDSATEQSAWDSMWTEMARTIEAAREGRDVRPPEPTRQSRFGVPEPA